MSRRARAVINPIYGNLYVLAYSVSKRKPKNNISTYRGR
jgi:hypothetical protein